MYTLDLKKVAADQNYRIDTKSANTFGKKLTVLISNIRIRLKWISSSKNKIIKKFFKYASELRHCSRIVEKTPHHYLHVHQILWTFPKAHVIWMIRHPIDVFTSSIKRSKLDSNYGHYWDVDKFVQEFKGSFARYEFYKKIFGRRLILVKYEDFVRDSKSELKTICRIIDEPFQEGALSLKKDQNINWKPDPHISSEIVAKTEKNWHDHISPEDAELIEAKLTGLMNKYNFPFYSNVD